MVADQRSIRGCGSVLESGYAAIGYPVQLWTTVTLRQLQMYYYAISSDVIGGP